MVMELLELTAQDAKTAAYINARASDYPWSIDQFQQSIRQANHFCRVIQQASKKIGFIIFSQIKDEANLLNIAVDPDFHRQGFGTQLLELGLAELKARTVVHCLLEVRVSNKAALAIYQRQGFQSVGQRKNYYPTSLGREDAIIMRRQL